MNPNQSTPVVAANPSGDLMGWLVSIAIGLVIAHYWTGRK